MSKTVTEKQLEANRQNAQRSTGPRTPEGQERAKWNALKHGLLARSTVVSSRDGYESQMQFDKLLIMLQQELKPQGILEEMLVEKIAVAYWRLRRASRVEAGKICDNVRQAREYSYSNHPGTRALPGQKDTDKIIRYENTIEKRLQNAIEQLTKLQTQRLRVNKKEDT